MDRISKINSLIVIGLLCAAPISCKSQNRQIALTLGTINTYAGTGVSGAPTSGAATSSKLDQPLSVAVDGSSNLYISETDSYINLVTASSGAISTIAGNGISGYTGDNGLATSAEVNVARGLAVDSSGDVYISDSGNNRVRVIYNGGSSAHAILVAEGVSSPVSGDIYTIAGNGNTSGGSASGTLGTSQTLNSPRGLYVDSSGDLYITDQAFVRILYAGGTNAETLIGEESTVTSPSTGYMYKVAGNGSNTYGGENVSATSTGMNPTSVAVDGSGNVYFTDQGFARVQKISISGTNAGKVSTVTGNGTAGGTGDGAAAASAEVNTVRGIAIDGAGNLYLADTNDNSIRKIDSSANINTIAGTNSATGGYSGDGSAATSASLDLPYDVALDPAGTLYIADFLNNRVRKVNVSSSSFSYASTALGSASAGQSVTVSNIGSLSVTLSGISVPAGFEQTSGSGTNCSSTTVLNPGAGCILQFAFDPAVVGPNSGTATVSSNGGSISIALAGTGLVAQTTTALTASATSILSGQTLTLTATPSSPGISPTGTVSFYDGTTLLGTSSLSSGSATFATTTTPAGSNNLTATYNGDTNNAASTSATVVVVDHGVTSTTLTGSTGSGTFGQSVVLTATVATNGSVAPTGAVTFTSSGSTLGTSTVSSGIATLSTTLPRKINSFAASYPGDSDNNASTSSSLTIPITETLADLMGNNTSACPASGTLPVYCALYFTGESDIRSGVETVVFNPPAGNVSDEDIHGYLNSGSGTKIYANFMDSFCTTVESYSEYGAPECVDNVMPGYNTNDVNTVQAQADDLFRRHFDGAIMTSEGAGGNPDQAISKLQTYLDNNYCVAGQGCTLSYGIQFGELSYNVMSTGITGTSGQGCKTTEDAATYESCLVAYLKNEMCYMNGTFWGNMAYIKTASGRPILQIDDYESSPLNPLNPAPSWQDVWNQVTTWNNDLPHNCLLPSGATTYAAQNGVPLLVFGGVEGYTHPDSAGAWYWPDSAATPPDPATTAEIEAAQNIFNITTASGTYNYIGNTAQWFYGKATTTYANNSTYQNWGAAFKGTNSYLSAWGIGRLMDQQCGMTWMETLTESNNFYTTTALPYLQLVTWNDYNSGTSIEPGIDNCYSVNASVSGSTLSWSLASTSTTDTPSVSTVSHIEIYHSPDNGATFTLMATQPAAASGTYSLANLQHGTHELYVYMVGKNSILNRISAQVPYSN